METAHGCRFRARLVWSGWERSGPLRERTARRVPACDACGREQPARRPRRTVLREVEAAVREALPVVDDAARTVALAAARRASARQGPIPARGVLGALAARGVPGSLAEAWLERLMRAGLVRLASRAVGTRELRSVTVLDAAGLEELARPGVRAARAAAMGSAIAALAGIDHPVAEDARRALTEEAESLSPELAQALAAVARHAAEGEVLAERVFSARQLGSSKALSRLRDAVEQRLGPLAALGIREGAAQTLVGGAGRLVLAGGASVDLAELPPFVGLSRETIARLERFDPSPRGVVAVENLTVFDGCCRGEVPELRGASFVWTAGYPGRSVRTVIEAARRAGAHVTVWCDLDLDGVRIARLVAGWAGDARFHRMGASDLLAATQALPLTARARRALDGELASGREDELTPLLRAIAERGAWVEQEALLGASASLGPRAGRPHPRTRA